MVYVLGLVLLLVGFWLLVFGSRLYGQPKVGEQISVWRTLIPLQSEPPQRFYTRLYQALKASLQDRLAEGDIDDDAYDDDTSSGSTSSKGAPVEVVLTGMGFGPHRLFAAPSLFAERPLYLLVRYKHLRCYIYAGQTPTGLFVSSWGYSDFQIGEQGLVAYTKRALNYFRRQTLFQYDAALMFTHCVHEILSDTVDGYLQQEGLKPLEAMERRPVLHAFYQNPFHQNPLLPNLFGQGTSSQSATYGQGAAYGLSATYSQGTTTPIVQQTPMAHQPTPLQPTPQEPAPHMPQPEPPMPHQPVPQPPMALFDLDHPDSSSQGSATNGDTWKSDGLKGGDTDEVSANGCAHHDGSLDFVLSPDSVPPGDSTSSDYDQGAEGVKE